MVMSCQDLSHFHIEFLALVSDLSSTFIQISYKDHLLIILFFFLSYALWIYRVNDGTLLGRLIDYQVHVVVLSGWRVYWNNLHFFEDGWTVKILEVYYTRFQIRLRYSLVNRKFFVLEHKLLMSQLFMKYLKIFETFFQCIKEHILCYFLNK